MAQAQAQVFLSLALVLFSLFLSEFGYSSLVVIYCMFCLNDTKWRISSPEVSLNNHLDGIIVCLVGHNPVCLCSCTLVCLRGRILEITSQYVTLSSPNDSFFRCPILDPTSQCAFPPIHIIFVLLFIHASFWSLLYSYLRIGHDGLHCVYYWC